MDENEAHLILLYLCTVVIGDYDQDILNLKTYKWCSWFEDLSKCSYLYERSWPFEVIFGDWGADDTSPWTKVLPVYRKTALSQQKYLTGLLDILVRQACWVY